MFRPNAVGKLSRVAGYDVHGRERLSAPVDCPFAPVALKNIADKTNVRADSSASRGAAEEMTSQARVLIVPTVRPSINDRFEFDGEIYKVVSCHVRRTVIGKVDHYECDLELMP